ncbi:hypothetical protein [Paludisphaera rhizosphaerae]|uniref:hypothetical protein n=1 Tax=Paludisphaera rhizosphaerae TaxID=2711216 RepID=UPI0013E9FBAF|nr:hypothetical protein [Paludisphaera rhizosphaerae]
MTRPGSTPSTTLAAALALVLGACCSSPAQADAITPSTATAYYKLTTDSSLAAPASNIDGPQVVAAVTPAGAVVPPTNADGSQGSPLTVLSSSHGFDPSQLVVALKDATASDGSPEQLLGLVFFGQGLQAGGELDFALSIDSALASNPPQLVSSTPGITISAIPDPTSTPTDTGGGSTDGETNVPEPVAFLFWAGAAGVIGLRARNRAGRRRAAPQPTT